MILANLTTDWRITLVFAAAMGALVAALKVCSVLTHRPPPGFWLAVGPSGDSLRRVRAATAGDWMPALKRWLLAATGFTVGWLAYWSIVRAGNLSGLWLGWLAAPLVWLMGEALGATLHLAWLPGGWWIPGVHENIFAARSLADFWGRHWNVWMSDWFRQVVFLPLRRRPLIAMGAVFVLSGVIHELVINLSLWLVTGRNLFGSMIAYFALQAAGMWCERSFLSRHRLAKRVFAWLVVVGPAPLIVNEGLLRAFHLWC